MSICLIFSEINADEKALAEKEKREPVIMEHVYPTHLLNMLYLVEYTLSELGETIRPILDSMQAWGENYKALKSKELNKPINKITAKASLFANPAYKAVRSFDSVMYLFACVEKSS